MPFSRLAQIRNNLPSGRAFWVTFIIVILASVLIAKLLYISVIRGADYADQALDTRTSTWTEFSKRGTIYDRNGQVLATTEDIMHIAAFTGTVNNPIAVANILAAKCGGDATYYLELMSSGLTTEGELVFNAVVNLEARVRGIDGSTQRGKDAIDNISYRIRKSNAHYQYLVKNVDDDVAAEIRTFCRENNITGIEFESGTVRVYPFNGLGGQIIGTTRVSDDQTLEGVSGLELYYDDILTGRNGVQSVQSGRGGTPMVDGIRISDAAIDGNDILISVDITLQEYVETILRNAQIETGCRSGSITVYDGGTGEIYAAASLELLDQEDWRANSSAAAFNLQNISGTYEPGSTFKSITAAILMENGVVTPDTVFEIPPVLPIDDFVITDAHPHGDLVYTFREVIANSSNIGTVLATSMFDRESYYNELIKYGIGSKTGVDFPGEASGILPDYADWTSATAYNVPFGQGVTVTPLRLVRTYGAFVNDGVAYTPHFLIQNVTTGEEPEWGSERIMTPETAATTSSLLESVVTIGGGWHAEMQYYTVAGKTGTAQIAQNGRYLPDEYIISFCGYLPYSGSKLICLVELEAPNVEGVGSYFASVMNLIADLYKLKQDR